MDTFIGIATWFVFIAGTILIGILFYMSGPYITPIQKFKLKIIKLRFHKLWLIIKPEFLKKSWWIADFPEGYHPKCFGCNFGPKACSKCEFRSWGENPGSIFENGKWIKCC